MTDDTPHDPAEALKLHLAEIQGDHLATRLLATYALGIIGQLSGDPKGLFTAIEKQMMSNPALAKFDGGNPTMNEYTLKIAKTRLAQTLELLRRQTPTNKPW